MKHPGIFVHLDQLSSSYFVLLLLTLLAIMAGFLFWIGLIPWALALVANILRCSIRYGFEVWQRLFAWTSWPVFLAVMATSLFIGWWSAPFVPYLTLVCAMIPMFMGVTSCMAYMMIDLERYAVSRGYKSIHNPLKGQELAVNIVRHGQAVGVPLLVSASIGMVGGFALLNLGLYETIGRNWYLVKEGQAEPTYVDFLANALIVLLRIVDVLDFFKANQLLEVSYVRQAKWPSSMLLAAFRMFFTVVLLQQLFASFRLGQVLSETITDLWNPHEPIHERACNALPQHGPGAVHPLLISLGRVATLTKEQRERLPPMLAAIGPAAIPSLIRHLHDEHDHVRAIAVASLGHLRDRATVVLLVPLSQDSSEVVRGSLFEALGIIAAPRLNSAESKVVVLSIRHRLLRSLKLKTLSVPIKVVEPVELAVKTLRSALSDESLAVRAQAAKALGRIGSLAVAAAPDLIALLKDEDETVRKEAIEAVGKVGGPTTTVVHALAGLLEDPSHQLRALAAKELGAMKDAAKPACPALVALLQDREETVRDAAAEAIGQIGQIDESATDEMVEGLASVDSVVRAQTAEGLGMIGETAFETAPALVEALDDRNDLVRAKAVEALGKIGESVADVAIPGLVRALRDEDNIVSSLAAEALGEMGDSADSAIPSLIHSLRHINADVRASAAESLGKLDVSAPGTAAALEGACRDEDASVRCKAVCALGMIDKPRSSTKKTVQAGLEDTDADVRSAVVDCLCKWGDLDDTTLRRFLLLLEDPNEKVRTQVTRISPQLAGATEDIVEKLCCRLREDTDLVQASAAQALGEIGSAAAMAGQVLLRAAQTGEANVREKAIRAIRLIRPSEKLAALSESEIEQGIIEELRAIENQTDGDLPKEEIDVIPIFVAPMVDPTTDQKIEITVTLIERDSTNGAVEKFSEPIEKAKSDDRQ